MGEDKCLHLASCVARKPDPIGARPKKNKESDSLLSNKGNQVHYNAILGKRGDFFID